MIQNPILIVLTLFIIESAVLFFASYEKTKKFFSFLPSIFWIYFLPMLAATLGIIDSSAPVLSWITKNLLPASLLILLIPVDLKEISRLGRTALIMFLAGSAGIMLGTIITFTLFKGVVGEEFWMGFGAISASWMGGSANMVAVKEAMGTPEDIFAPMIIVDTVVPYVWMGILVGLCGLQKAFDHLVKADRSVLEHLGEKLNVDKTASIISYKGILAAVLIGIVGTKLAQWLAPNLPIVEGVVSTYAWVIILVSVMGIVGSLTPARKLEAQGLTKIGYWLLYFVLTTIGAKANLSGFGSTLILIGAGFVIVLIQAVVLIAVARWLKAPMFLVATASQANIGGVASGPIIAELYHPGLASVGLLMAILGNVCGTYLGILCAQLCRFIASI